MHGRYFLQGLAICMVLTMSSTPLLAGGGVAVGIGFGGYGPHGYGGVGLGGWPGYYYPYGAWGGPYWDPWWGGPYSPYYYPPEPPVITPSIVMAPLVGTVVPYLPRDFNAQIIDGTTYYVAGGVYYKAVPEGYLVTSSPAAKSGTEDGAVVAIPVKGQPPAQQDNDRRECRDQAHKLMGRDGSGFRAAVGECLEARGYTVK